MKNLTTPQAILGGFVLVALAIASIPYSSNIVSPAHATGVQKVAICHMSGRVCATVLPRLDAKHIGELFVKDMGEVKPLSERLR